MNRAAILGTTLTLGSGGIIAGAVLDPPAVAQDASRWLTSYPAAQAAARQQGKPIFLVFR